LGLIHQSQSKTGSVKSLDQNLLASQPDFNQAIELKPDLLRLLPTGEFQTANQLDKTRPLASLSLLPANSEQYRAVEAG
jgi:hypothetical protein